MTWPSKITNHFVLLLCVLLLSAPITIICEQELTHETVRRDCENRVNTEMQGATGNERVVLKSHYNEQTSQCFIFYGLKYWQTQWQKARNKCQQDLPQNQWFTQGDLAKFDDMNKESILHIIDTAKLGQTYCKDFYESGKYFVGGKKVNCDSNGGHSKSDFQWLADQSSMANAAWASNQPETAAGDHCCVQFWCRAGAGFVAQTCAKTDPHFFICSQQLLNPIPTTTTTTKGAVACALILAALCFWYNKTKRELKE